MMYQFRDKKQIYKRKKIIRNLIGFGLFFVLVCFGILSLSGKLFNFVGSPIWKAEQFVLNKIYNINYLLRSKQAISLENHNLIDEISSLRLSMIDYQILKNENNELKELLSRPKIKENFILGNILTKPNHSPYDTIIIDIGLNNGIQEGSYVYTNGNIPIGVVSKVYDQTSLVVLYTNPGQKTEGFLDGTNASVLLSGRGGGNFEMILPIELQINNGDVVYLPGDSPLILAYIDEIISKPSDPYKKVILSSPVNIQNLKWVEVKK